MVSRIDPSLPQTGIDQPVKVIRDNFQFTKIEIEELQGEKISRFGDQMQGVLGLVSVSEGALPDPTLNQGGIIFISDFSTGPTIAYSDGFSWNTAFGGATPGLSAVVEDTTPTLGGPLDADGFKISNLPSPTAPSDAVPLSYVDSIFVPIAGGTMTGFLTLNADPTLDLHATTKQYVDSVAGSGSFLDRRGTTVAGNEMLGNLDMDGFRIIGLPSPTQPSDPVTLSFADANYIPQAGGVFVANSLQVPLPSSSNDVANLQSVNNAVANRVARTGDSMTGFLTLNANPTQNLHAATKQYVDNIGGDFVQASGDQMTGDLLLGFTTPPTTTSAVARAYVDNNFVRSDGSGSVQQLNIINSPAFNSNVVTLGFLNTQLGGFLEASQNLSDVPNVVTAANNLQVLSLQGGTLTGDLILNNDPTVNLEAATKQYVDNNLSNGVGLIEMLPGFVERPSENKTYVLISRAAYAFTVDEVHARTGAGTLDFRLAQGNGTGTTIVTINNVGNSTNGTTVSPGTTVSSGNRLLFVTSNISSAFDLEFTIRTSRV